MKISNSTPRRQSRSQDVSSQVSLGPELNPFTAAKNSVSHFVGESVEIGKHFAGGAAPGYGVVKHFGGLWSGNGNIDRAGMALNAAGTAGLAVALTQFALDSNPTIALAFSAATLGGSGIAAVISNQ